MTKFLKRAVMSAGVALLLAGCASTSPLAYYLLTPQPAENANAPAVAPAAPALQVAIPAYADRPQIVFQDTDGTVELSGNDRWAEALDGMIKRVLAQDIAQRPVPPTSASINVTIDAFVFGDGTVRLTAHWTATPKAPAKGMAASHAILVHRFAADLPVPDQYIDSYVQAMSRLIAQLAADIAP